MVAIVTVTVIFALALSLMTIMQAQYASVGQSIADTKATLAAQAGLVATNNQLNSNDTFAGFTNEQTVDNDTSGRTTYVTNVTSNADGSKIILATGRSYRALSTTPNDTKRIRAVVVNKQESVQQSLVFGSGGVNLGQGSGLYGKTYISGNLQMGPSSFVGAPNQSTTLDINNLACGTSTNWPQPCGAGNPPIMRSGPPDSAIYGTVCARDQTSTTGIFPGTNPVGMGLRPGCAPRMSIAPKFNKKDFVSSINPTPLTTSSYTCPSGGVGTISIPANSRINGNVNVYANNGDCNVRLEGNLYITGSLSMINYGSGRIILSADDSVGSVSPIIVVNRGFYPYSLGTANTKISALNSYGTPFYIMDFESTNAACSTSDTVPSNTVTTCLSPAEAQASAATTTPGAYQASTVDFDASGTILYKYYSNMTIGAGNKVQVYGFGAQGLTLGGNSTITTVAPDAPFSNVLSFPRYRIIEYQTLYDS